MTIEIQEQLYTTLSDALSMPVYDDPEGEGDFPYVTIDNVEITQGDWLNENISTYFVYLTIWSKYRGKKEITETADVIYGVLHRKSINTSTGHIIDVQVIRQQYIRDIDELTYMGKMTIQIRYQH